MPPLHARHVGIQLLACLSLSSGVFRALGAASSSSTCDSAHRTELGSSLLQTHKNARGTHVASELRKGIGIGKLGIAAKANTSDNTTPGEYALQMKQGRFARAARQVPPNEILENGVAVVVPGLGEESRAQLVKKNIQWLKKQGIPFECWIFVYKSEEKLPLNDTDYEPCNITRHQGFWMSHVLEMPLNLTKMPFILHILDGIEPQEDVNLKSMCQIMRDNSLGEASATFPKCPYLPVSGHDLCPWPIMVRNESFKIGRQVDFIEYHFTMFTREYFACLQDQIDVNSTLGWGMAFVVPWQCGGMRIGSVEKNGKIGLLDHMSMKKLMAGSYNRTMAAEESQDFLRKFPDVHRPLVKVLGPLH